MIDENKNETLLRNKLEKLIYDNCNLCIYEASLKKSFRGDLIKNKIESYRRCIADVGEILLVADNSVDWIEIFVACMLEGKKLYVVDSKSSDDDIVNFQKELCVEFVLSEKPIKSVKTYTFDELYNRHVTKVKNYECSELILFTTGTTGNPKGVRITLENIFSVAESFQRRVNFSDEDNTLLITPFSHVMGFIMMFNTICYSGGGVISNDEGNTLYSILYEKVNLMAAPPILLNILRNNEKFAEKLKKFRLLISGGAVLSKDTYNWYEKNDINLINGYGMTECVAVVGLTGESDDKRELDALDWCEIKLADDGEILIRGKGVCKEYITGEKISDEFGWYHTGDVGVLQERTFFVSHRKNNVIVLQNGFKINIDNLEERISCMDNVQDCRVYIKKELEKVCVEILPQNHADTGCASEDFKNRIKAILKYYEKVDEVTITEKISTNRGKKVRYE